MNKSELVDHIAGSANISKAAALCAVNAMIAAIETTLKNGGEVSLAGFGTFRIAKRKVRTGFNLQTGEILEVKSPRTPEFRAGKRIKDAVK
jgi:DNA-binding protein HU-beta